ncbi:MAG TPA: hypothetical protein ENI73_04885 [Spirochaetes bacterium]|nr:hypothetical protein [Spirochaetota bacterium]
MKKSNLLRLTVISMIAVISITLTNCGARETRQPIDKLSDLGKNEVIVVGRIVVDPPFAPDEQSFSPKGLSDWYKDIITLGTYQKDPPAGKYDYDQFGADEGKDMFLVKLNKTFFLKGKNRSFYIVGGSVVMKYENRGNSVHITTRAYPARFKVNIRPNDKAVYIGTLIYKRNDFGDVKKVKFKNEYKKAKKEFRKKFGRSLKLRKSLLQPVK